MEILTLDYKTAIDFVLPRHYSGRKPVITKAFGLYEDGVLKGVCTFGKPASKNLCSGVCGEDYSSQVYELNRLCVDGNQTCLSQFVAGCLKLLQKENWIVVSYADTQMQHNGYIYQACNFIYTGCTKKRTDPVSKDGKHARHIKTPDVELERQIRHPKHRYVYFCMPKLAKKKALNSLKYPILSYPKGENLRYNLGDYVEPTIISK